MPRARLFLGVNLLTTAPGGRATPRNLWEQPGELKKEWCFGEGIVCHLRILSLGPVYFLGSAQHDQQLLTVETRTVLAGLACGNRGRCRKLSLCYASEGLMVNVSQLFFFHFLSLGRCWMVTESLSFTSQAELGQDA